MNEKIHCKLISPEMKFSGVYLILNLSNNKFYVGSAVNLAARRRNHFGDLRREQHRNIYLQRAYNKNPDMFIMFLLERVDDKKSLINREQFWIDELESTYDKNGYNILKRAGSQLGFKHNDETKFRIGQMQIGRKLSSEHKKKIGESHIGRKHSDESKRKMKENNTRKIPIVQYDLQDNFLNEYESITEAALSLGINIAPLARCCKGILKTYKGFKWKYKEKVA